MLKCVFVLLLAVGAVQSTGNKSNVSTLAANERKTEAVQALAAHDKTKGPPAAAGWPGAQDAEKPGSSPRLSVTRVCLRQKYSTEYGEISLGVHDLMNNCSVHTGGFRSSKERLLYR